MLKTAPLPIPIPLPQVLAVVLSFGAGVSAQNLNNNNSHVSILVRRYWFRRCGRISLLFCCGLQRRRVQRASTPAYVPPAARPPTPLHGPRRECVTIWDAVWLAISTAVRASAVQQHLRVPAHGPERGIGTAAVCQGGGAVNRIYSGVATRPTAARHRRCVSECVFSASRTPAARAYLFQLGRLQRRLPPTCVL
ncbi:hypothetical protein B0H11DRAFT_2100892, partial [Mycena galericulata]